MLILTRATHEGVVINVGDVRIRVSVDDIRPRQVRLAFEAPEHVEIWRDELMQSIDEKKAIAKRRMEGAP